MWGETEVTDGVGSCHSKLNFGIRWNRVLFKTVDNCCQDCTIIRRTGAAFKVRHVHELRKHLECSPSIHLLTLNKRRHVGDLFHSLTTPSARCSARVLWPEPERSSRNHH
jgi:hypothetical protein